MRFRRGLRDGSRAGRQRRSSVPSAEAELALLLLTLVAMVTLLLPSELRPLPLAAAVTVPALTVLLAVWWFVHRQPANGPRRPTWWHGYLAGCVGLIGTAGVVRSVADHQADDRIWYACLALGMATVARLELAHARGR